MESSTQALIQQSLESLDAQIMAFVRGEEIGEAAAPEPPSELEFAAGVTRKMLEDMVPADQRRDLLQLVLMMFAFLFVLRAVSNWWMNRLASKVADEIENRNRR